MLGWYSFLILQGIPTSIAKNPYRFGFFSGGSGTPIALIPSGMDLCMVYLYKYS